MTHLTGAVAVSFAKSTRSIVEVPPYIGVGLPPEALPPA